MHSLFVTEVTLQAVNHNNNFHYFVINVAFDEQFKDSAMNTSHRNDNSLTLQRNVTQALCLLHWPVFSLIKRFFLHEVGESRDQWALQDHMHYISTSFLACCHED